MKRLALPLACALALSACSAPQLAALGTRAALSPETVATITNICRQGEPLIRMAGALPLPASAKEIAAFVAGYCDPLLAGSVPATTDGNTVSWLETNLGGLRAVLGK